MPHYRLLAIDIDGTLLTSGNELTDATCSALRRATAAGIHVVLATGRRYSRTLHLVEPLGLTVPLVTASGALVKDPADHRTLYRARFEPAALCSVLHAMDEQGYHPIVCADTFSEGFDFYTSGAEVTSEELREYFGKNPDAGRVDAQLLHRPPENTFCTFTMGTHDQMLKLEEHLLHRLPGKLHAHVLRSPLYAGFMCEVAPAGVTKWSAIHRLARQWGIADGEVCAVGDDVNDIPMIRAAGLGVAMGNAVPSVKAVAARIAPTQDENGLAEVVQWLLDGPC
ncbi:MAG: Cof-type HAD-IIB family hydrolase [Patescibacteria group bacterium]|nr:Cof-type HAD-IIB family hydrolase [Patescibacteria group bacterium]